MSNFLLSGSADSNIYVWSIPGLLSFSARIHNGTGENLPLSPLRSLSSHRAAIVSLSFGHCMKKNNVAVSISKDKTCVVFNHLNSTVLHTFLLPDTPLCMALDPVDRAIYVGYEDGSVHLIDLYQDIVVVPRQDRAAQATATEPSLSGRWKLPDGTGDRTTLSIAVCYDGTTILSGHQDGKVQAWNVGKRRYSKRLAEFPGPVTFLHFLPLEGLRKIDEPGVRLDKVTKPTFEGFAKNTAGNAGSVIPANYNFTARFVDNLHPQKTEKDIHYLEFLIEDTIARLWSEQTSFTNGHSPELAEVQAQNDILSAKLTDAESRHHALNSFLEKHRQKEKVRKREEEVKAARKQRRRIRRKQTNEIKRKSHMGEPIEDGGAGSVDQATESEMDLSTSTDEMSDSD